MILFQSKPLFGTASNNRSKKFNVNKWNRVITSLKDLVFHFSRNYYSFGKHPYSLLDAVFEWSFISGECTVFSLRERGPDSIR